MTCPMCGRNYESIVGPYKITQCNIQGGDEGGETQVCGQCFTLIAILDELMEITEALGGRPRQSRV